MDLEIHKRDRQLLISEDFYPIMKCHAGTCSWDFRADALVMCCLTFFTSICRFTIFCSLRCKAGRDGEQVLGSAYT